MQQEGSQAERLPEPESEDLFLDFDGGANYFSQFIVRKII